MSERNRMENAYVLKKKIKADTGRCPRAGTGIELLASTSWSALVRTTVIRN